MKSRLHSHIGTLRQLEILLAVYDHSSIKAASATLHLTQPTVSMQLKKLSEAINMPLYDLVGKQLVFTEAGKEVAATAREVLGSIDRLDMSLSNLRGLKSGTLRLAVVTTSEYFIPHLLGPFCERYPEVDVQLKVGNRQQIIERLKQGTDDFYVFSHPPTDIQTDYIEFLTNPLVAIAREGHPLSEQGEIELKDIGNEPFLMREIGSGTRYAIENFMQEAEVKLNIKMTIESNEAIKHAVMSGLGISILSAHTLVYGGQAGLAKLPVKQLPINTHWYFVWRSPKKSSVIAEEFLKHVQSEGKRMVQAELKKNGFNADSTGTGFSVKP